MIFEIGSEFHEDSAPKGENSFSKAFDRENVRFVQSGRTGLALIAEELQYHKNIQTIALPSYCCSSMVYPFYHKGFSVIFYPLPGDFTCFVHKEIEEALAIIQKADAVLIMDYFGFVRDFSLQLAEQAKKHGKSIIVDGTQTAFSQSEVYKLADYMLVSYRKWSDLLCAEVVSKTGFKTPAFESEYEDFSHTWRNAAYLKKQYLKREINNKSDYLNLYKRANHLLSVQYEKYSAADDEIKKTREVDANFLIAKRRDNARFLIESLKKYQKSYSFQLLFQQVKKEDCPMFVPIFVKGEKRDIIQEKLISKNIFCPAHWPIDRKYPFCETSFHEREISLICDQRYTIEDMKRELSELLKVLHEV